MKSCRYCGRDNDDAAVHCARCGSDEWNELTTPKPLPSKPAAQPAVAPSGAGITTYGSIISIPCRTLQEAALVAEELEQADIVPLLSGKSFEDDPHDRGTKSSLRIQVSAKALAAERDLFESLNFRSEVHCAQQPLPLGMKMIAFCLPALLSAGCLVFLAGAGRFRNQGFVRKLRDWKRWFLFGWIIWAAAVLFVVRLAGA